MKAISWRFRGTGSESGAGVRLPDSGFDIRMTKSLQSCRDDTVAIQATGVYWIALRDILTNHGIGDHFAHQKMRECEMVPSSVL
jgi:hypothetical protein